MCSGLIHIDDPIVTIVIVTIVKIIFGIRRVLRFHFDNLDNDNRDNYSHPFQKESYAHAPLSSQKTNSL